MELFIETQFNHNPITWMFHRGKTEQRLNQLWERASQLIPIMYFKRSATKRELTLCLSQN